MTSNKKLHKAKDNKKDEFYTQYEDIQSELNHYVSHFKDKVVLCNCDDPYESNFFQFFIRNFNYLKLKKLICTCYVDSPIAGTQMSFFDDEEDAVVPSNGYVIEVSDLPMKNNRGVTDDDITSLLLSRNRGVKKLKGDGDFRSPECLNYLKEADIVVGNPPFSLFREYVEMLFYYKKNFLIIGNKNAVTYKDFFEHLQNNEVWSGVRNWAGGMWFIVPDSYKPDKKIEGKSLKNVPSCWFTNLDHNKRHEKIILYRKYNPEEYPYYDNFDAVNVDKVTDIPMDFKGVMGVPISLLDKYNPDQFEIIGLDRYTAPKDVLVGGRLAIGGKSKFARILIRNRELQP